MDKNIAIEFENVGKQYRLGLVGTGSLQHDINRWWQTTILRKEDPYLKIGEVNDRSTKGHSDYVWALKDISFKVEQGDVVGIIGKNGAGKSTLLKLLSHITAPTTGDIWYRGRIASLLEVGTGFHPEMTARQNIYMNGSIMGMKRHEIARKLDEIVDFAGIERYLDTPVKRFSSGMSVRLGFAVAAFLEPEILVVDEVLAVGDAEFQKKAIGKMKDVSQGGGRTVLFVSHNLATIKSLCQKGVLLDKGQIYYKGSANDTVSTYLDLCNGNVASEASVDVSQSKNRLHGMKPAIQTIRLLDKNGNNRNNFFQDEEIYIEVTYDATKYEDLAGMGFILYSDESQVGGGNTYMAFPPPHKLARKGCVVFRLDSKQFIPRTYSITVSVGPHQSRLLDKVERCISFTIEPTDVYGTGYILTKDDGVSLMRFSASIKN